MEFDKEDWVRIYVRPSATARIWSFWTRMLMDQLVKTADKAGVIWLPQELIADKHAAIASVLECPDVDWIAEHYPPIERHGAAVSGSAHTEDGSQPYLYLPRYRAAQYAKGSKDLNNRRYQSKVIAFERAIELNIISEDEA